MREFVLHYKKYKIDKIIIYDNNDIHGEKFEFIIDDYIKLGLINIVNIRGKEGYQYKAMQHCLNNNYKKYQWILFIDMDEFIYLRHFDNIKKYLNQTKFLKCEVIQLNTLYHSDNNLLFYDNRTLSRRFKSSIKPKNEQIKSILKGNIKINIKSVHFLADNLKSCNGYGEYNINEKYLRFTKAPDYINYYFDHYNCKSTEEFIEKINRGSAIFGKNISSKLSKINLYFKRNKITFKKIDLIEKYTKINLSKYRYKIISNKI